MKTHHADRWTHKPTATLNIIGWTFSVFPPLSLSMSFIPIIEKGRRCWRSRDHEHHLLYVIWKASENSNSSSFFNSESKRNVQGKFFECFKLYVWVKIHAVKIQNHFNFILQRICAFLDFFSWNTAHDDYRNILCFPSDFLWPLQCLLVSSRYTSCHKVLDGMWFYWDGVFRLDENLWLK